MASLKTVKKWEETLSCDLEKEIRSGKVVKLKCKLCTRYEGQITSMRVFSRSWIKGSNSVKKDSVTKHINGDPYKYAAELEKKERLGAVAFNQNIIENTPIGCGLIKMADHDREHLPIALTQLTTWQKMRNRILISWNF